MQLRKRLFPKTFSDVGGLTFLLIMIQLVFWFELFLVIPQHYPDRNGLFYVHYFTGTWLLFNIVGNFVIVFLQDTSITGKFMASEMLPGWRFCDVCEAIVPPRSWHCPICNVCILKRDHHCTFTACCIGHLNHRYFLMLLLHLSVATTYASYFNAFWLYKWTHFNVIGTLKLIFPFAFFIFGNDMSLLQLYRTVCVITIVGGIAAVSLCYYHFENVISGRTMYERAKKISKYQLRAVENLKQVLGARWYLTWISPFIRSELPSDGVNWDEGTLLDQRKDLSSLNLDDVDVNDGASNARMFTVQGTWPMSTSQFGER